MRLAFLTSDSQMVHPEPTKKEIAVRKTIKRKQRLFSVLLGW